MKCSRCKDVAQVALPGHHSGFCPDCFMLFFSRQVERAVSKHKMFTKRDKVLVALSGGKDSLALFRELVVQGYDVTGLHIDLGIPQSSPAARAKVEAFCREAGGRLEVLDLASEGLPIPLVKERVRRPICSMCGKIKRYFFNKAALDGGYAALCTGHNLDDEVGRLLANTLRWDVGYLSDQGPVLAARDGFAARCRPLYRLTEFETAAYCFFAGIDHHKAECPYSKGASFTVRKQLMNRLERESPGSKLSFYEAFLKQGRPVFEAAEKEQGPELAPCERCGYPTSAEICGLCRVREMLGDSGEG
ncbi:ATP-binding protein [Desulfocurvus sp. DL9XJH121]